MLTELKQPLQQLLTAATKAERTLKAGKEQFNRQQAKHAATQAKKAAPASQASPAMYDQGIGLAKQIERVDCKKFPLENVLDLGSPVVIQAADVLKDFLECGRVKDELDGFKANFEIARKNAKGVRASKAISPDSVGEGGLQSKLHEWLKGILISSETMKKHDILSAFGIDVGYDKVSCEPCCMAAARLTIEGTRTVIVTDWLQLLGFMQRKGASTPIPLTRQASFLRSMSPDMLASYAQECALWTTTLQPGDLLISPFGSLVGEQVTQLMYGLRCPLHLNLHADGNMASSVAKKIQDVEQAVATSKDDPSKQRLEAELSQLTDLQKC